MSQVTKRAIEQSLKNLLLKKPLTKITINDLAEDCGINRMTFYYHFKDIYDLVEWVCLEDARRALEEKKTYDTWQQGLLQIFEAVQENKPFSLTGDYFPKIIVRHDITKRWYNESGVLNIGIVDFLLDDSII